MGLVEQMKRDDMKLKPLLRPSADDNVGTRGSDDDHEEQVWEAFDDVTGEELDPKEVIKARLKEMEYIRKKRVWRKMSRREAKRRGIKIKYHEQNAACLKRSVLETQRA